MASHSSEPNDLSMAEANDTTKDASTALPVPEESGKASDWPEPPSEESAVTPVWPDPPTEGSKPISKSADTTFEGFYPMSQLPGPPSEEFDFTSQLPDPPSEESNATLKLIDPLLEGQPTEKSLVTSLPDPPSEESDTTSSFPIPLTEELNMTPLLPDPPSDVSACASPVPYAQESDIAFPLIELPNEESDTTLLMPSPPPQESDIDSLLTAPPNEEPDTTWLMPAAPSQEFDLESLLTAPNKEEPDIASLLTAPPPQESDIAWLLPASPNEESDTLLPGSLNKESDTLLPAPLDKESDTQVPGPPNDESDTPLPVTPMEESDTLLPTPLNKESDILLPAPPHGEYDTLLPAPPTEDKVLSAPLNKESDTLLPALSNEESDTFLPAPLTEESDTLWPIPPNKESDTPFPAPPHEESDMLFPVSPVEESDTLLPIPPTEESDTLLPAPPSEESDILLPAAPIEQFDTLLPSPLNEESDTLLPAPPSEESDTTSLLPAPGLSSTEPDGVTPPSDKLCEVSNIVLEAQEPISHTNSQRLLALAQDETKTLSSSLGDGHQADENDETDEGQHLICETEMLEDGMPTEPEPGSRKFNMAVNDEPEHGPLVNKPLQRPVRTCAVLCLAFFFVYTANLAIQNLQSSLHQAAGLGVTSLAVLYGSIIVFGSLSPLVIRFLSAKRTLVIAFVSHLLYTLSNFYPTFPTLLTSSLLLGVMAGPMWTAQGLYCTATGLVYAAVKQIDTHRALSLFNGVFFAFYEATQISGNLIASMVLMRGSYNDTVSHENKTCGAAVCPETEISSTKIEQPEKHIVYILLSIYLACNVVGLLLTIFVLPPLPRDQEIQGGESSLKKSTTSCLSMLLVPKMLLLLPFFMAQAMNSGILLSEYSQKFVSCAIGIQWVGYVMTAFGGLTSAQAVGLNYAARFLGRRLLFTAAATADLSVNVAMLLWDPTGARVESLFILPCVSGFAEGIFQAQFNSLVAMVFPKQVTAAFATYHTSKATAFTLTFVMSRFLCLGERLYVSLALSSLGLVGYAVVECMIHRDKRQGQQSVARD